MRLPLTRVLVLALAALALAGCTQNDANIAEGAEQIVLTTTGGSASAFSVAGAIFMLVLNVALWRHPSEGEPSFRKTASKLLVAAFLAAMTLMYAHEGFSRPVLEVSGARREVRLKETLLGAVITEKIVRADQLQTIRARKFYRSGKWKRGDWGSIAFATREGVAIEFEASQGFAGQARGLGERMGAMLKIPVE